MSVSKPMRSFVATNDRQLCRLVEFYTTLFVVSVDIHLPFTQGVASLTSSDIGASERLQKSVIGHCVVRCARRVRLNKEVHGCTVAVAWVSFPWRPYDDFAVTAQT